MMLAVSFRMSQSLCVCVCHAGVIYSASKSQCLVFHRMSVTTTSKCWCHVTTKLSLHVEPMRSTPPVATTRYDESISVTHIHTHLHTVITSYRWVDFWSFLLKNQNWQSTCTHLPKFVSIKMNLNIRPVQNRIYSALSQKWINILFFFLWGRSVFSHQHWLLAKIKILFFAVALSNINRGQVLTRFPSTYFWEIWGLKNAGWKHQ